MTHFILFGKEVKRGPAMFHPITGRRLEPVPKPNRPDVWTKFIRDGKAEVARAERTVFDNTRCGA